MAAVYYVECRGGVLEGQLRFQITRRPTYYFQNNLFWYYLSCDHLNKSRR